MQANDSTFTPGPWEASDGPHQKTRNGWPTPRQWKYVQHNFPWTPYEGDLDDEWGIYPPIGESGPVALVAGEANARLIAAAPEMVDVLRRAAEQLAHCLGNENPIVIEARTLLAKAGAL